MPKHTLALAIVVGAETFNLSKSVTDAQARAIDEVLAANTVNFEVDIVLTRAQVKALMLSCVGGDLTIKTNSTGAPADTVVMASGDLTYWSSTAGFGTDQFPTADVTKLYLSSVAGTTFALRAIVSATNG